MTCSSKLFFSLSIWSLICVCWDSASCSCSFNFTILHYVKQKTGETVYRCNTDSIVWLFSLPEVFSRSGWTSFPTKVGGKIQIQAHNLGDAVGVCLHLLPTRQEKWNSNSKSTATPKAQQQKIKEEQGRFVSVEAALLCSGEGLGSHVSGDDDNDNGNVLLLKPHELEKLHASAVSILFTKLTFSSCRVFMCSTNWLMLSYSAGADGPSPEKQQITFTLTKEQTIRTKQLSSQQFPSKFFLGKWAWEAGIAMTSKSVTFLVCVHCPNYIDSLIHLRVFPLARWRRPPVARSACPSPAPRRRVFSSELLTAASSVILPCPGDWCTLCFYHWASGKFRWQIYCS